MNTTRCCLVGVCVLMCGGVARAQSRRAEPSAAPSPEMRPGAAGRVARAQVPRWSEDDTQFFLHGSMSAEFVPERVLTAFRATYPDLFPREGFSAFGLIEPLPAAADRGPELPIGVTRREVPHLAGLTSLGINCAACHVGEVSTRESGALRILGVTSHFDVEAFLGAVIAATYRTADPENMHHFLAQYSAAADGDGDIASLVDKEWERQSTEIKAALAADPFGAEGVAAGELHALSPDDLRLDRKMLAGHAKLAPTVRGLLKLFHNMRTALHAPDRPPESLPPASGPGRNNAFGLLSAALFGVPTIYAPVKFGLVWNLDQRTWVHWDGNTRAPIIRNLAAALGLGAPLIGKRGQLDFALVDRHTRLSELIRAPRYPFAIDHALAERGERHYQARCASCHDPASEDHRLHALDEIGTDPNRAKLFDARQAELYNAFFAGLEVAGYKPPGEPAVRSTQKYWAPDLAGVWARAPYLHNGSVRTVRDLLTAPPSRPRVFHRGTAHYDTDALGFADEGPYVLDTMTEGNSCAGHDYGTDLTDDEKRELIEYLKTR